MDKLTLKVEQTLRTVVERTIRVRDGDAVSKGDLIEMSMMGWIATCVNLGTDKIVINLIKRDNGDWFLMIQANGLVVPEAPDNVNPTP